MEYWKVIPDYDGKYLASNFGNIKNKITGNILSQFNDKDGYKMVSINSKPKRVHRLVASAFLGNFPDLQINHKDGVKSNNNIINLEWCTCKENNIHRCRVLGYKGTPHHCQKVLCVETGIVYNSIHEASRLLNLKRSNINNAIHHKHRTLSTGGFHWKLVGS